MDQYAEFLRNLKIVDLKKVLRAHGVCEYGLRSTLIARFESLIFIEEAAQQHQQAVENQNNNAEFDCISSFSSCHSSARASVDSRAGESDSDISVSSKCSLEGAIPRKCKTLNGSSPLFNYQSDCSSTGRVKLRLSSSSPPLAYAERHSRLERRELLSEGFKRRQRLYERFSSCSDSGSSPENTSNHEAPVVGARLIRVSDSDTSLTFVPPGEVKDITDNLLNLKAKPKPPKTDSKHRLSLSEYRSAVHHQHTNDKPQVKTPSPCKVLQTSPFKTNKTAASQSITKPPLPNITRPRYPITVFDYDTRLVRCTKLQPANVCHIHTPKQLESSELVFGACAPTVLSTCLVVTCTAEITEAPIVMTHSSNISNGVAHEQRPACITEECVEVTAEVNQQTLYEGAKPKRDVKSIHSKFIVPWKTLQQKVKVRTSICFHIGQWKKVMIYMHVQCPLNMLNHSNSLVKH